MISLQVLTFFVIFYLRSPKFKFLNVEQDTTHLIYLKKKLFLFRSLLAYETFYDTQLNSKYKHRQNWMEHLVDVDNNLTIKVIIIFFLLFWAYLFLILFFVFVRLVVLVVLGAGWVITVAERRVLWFIASWYCWTKVVWQTDIPFSKYWCRSSITTFQVQISSLVLF